MCSAIGTHPDVGDPGTAVVSPWVSYTLSAAPDMHPESVMSNQPSRETLLRLSRHAITMADASELAKAGRAQIEQLAAVIKSRNLANGAELLTVLRAAWALAK